MVAETLRSTHQRHMHSDTDIKKQGLALFLTLEGKAHKSILELDVKDINGDPGVQNVNCLNKLYLEDTI